MLPSVKLKERIPYLIVPVPKVITSNNEPTNQCGKGLGPVHKSTEPIKILTRVKILTDPVFLTLDPSLFHTIVPHEFYF